MDELRLVQELIAQGDFILTQHAKKRMAERNIARQDIQSCAQTGFVGLSANKYVLVGKDCDGEILKVICVFENNVLIITVF